MVSIRGPRSALTDFIEEHKIKIVKHDQSIVCNTNQVRTKKTKVMKKTQPKEITNIDKNVKKLEDLALNAIYQNYKTFQMNDNLLDLFSKYLSRERKMNIDLFSYLVASCEKRLFIYDCSMIKDSEFVIKENLETLELHYAGQITERRLNLLLKKQTKLKRLVITGAYLLESFTPPKSLIYLDVTNCSRLSNKFITQINKSFKKLNTLKLSYCYGLTDKCVLKIAVENLYICETYLTFAGISHNKNIYKAKSLSIKGCTNILASEGDEDLDIGKFTLLEHLDCEGISTLQDVRITEKIVSLNLSYCYNINIDFLRECTDLEYLNLSKVNIVYDKVKLITKLTKLRMLNISWTESLTDNLLLDIITNCKNLEKIYVFGCFNLTTKIGELAWSKSNSIEIIGNPSETRYLLNY